MNEVILDKQFQYLLPVLDENVFSDLEADILENGIRDSLVLWEGILIDGYNRYKIAQKHNLTFNTISMDFNSRDDVVIWIIKNQIVRRNLTPFQLKYYRGLHFHADRRLFINSEGTNQYSEDFRQNGGRPQTLATARKLAEIYNVSPRTIERDSRLANALTAIGEVSQEAKLSILSGETKITRNELDAVLADPESLAADLADSIDTGSFAEQRKMKKQDSIQSLDTAFSKISTLIQKELKGLSNSYTPSQVKSALRSHISVLEDIYKQL